MWPQPRRDLLPQDPKAHRLPVIAAQSLLYVQSSITMTSPSLSNRMGRRHRREQADGSAGDPTQCFLHANRLGRVFALCDEHAPMIAKRGHVRYRWSGRSSVVRGVEGRGRYSAPAMNCRGLQTNLYMTQRTALTTLLYAGTYSRSWLIRREPSVLVPQTAVSRIIARNSANATGMRPGDTSMIL